MSAECYNRYIAEDIPQPEEARKLILRNMYSSKNIDHYQDKAILCPNNEDVGKLNYTITMYPHLTYLSVISPIKPTLITHPYPL